MPSPIIKSGKFHAGKELVCGSNVLIDVAEEVQVGDRCVLPDNAYLGGRSISIGNDFYGYSYDWKRLDIGRGRRDDEYATLNVGDRCTFHDNRIDLACDVDISDDVGLSPEVVIYTHYYWQSILEGFPCKYAAVTIRNSVLVGFRSTILPGVTIGEYSVIGTNSVVATDIPAYSVAAGNPAYAKREILLREISWNALGSLIKEYVTTLTYRNIYPPSYPVIGVYDSIHYGNCYFSVMETIVEGKEDEFTDDLRDFLFKRGIRFYTQRPFKKLPRREA